MKILSFCHLRTSAIMYTLHVCMYTWSTLLIVFVRVFKLINVGPRSRGGVLGGNGTVKKIYTFLASMFSQIQNDGEMARHHLIPGLLDARIKASAWNC